MTMRGPLIRLLLIVQLVNLAHAQIGEIASLLTGVLAPQVVSSAGVGAAGAAATGSLGSIGTLYKLAENALQLTGKGVGILNQASEGKWFSVMAENAINSQREFQDKLLTAGARPDQLSLLGTQNSGLGPSSMGGFTAVNLDPEFSRLGTQFPAPGPGDYDTNEELGTTKKQSLIAIGHTDSSGGHTEPPTTTESPVTLFPEEKLEKKNEELDALLKKSIKSVPIERLYRTEDEYYDDIKFDEDEHSQQTTDMDQSISFAQINTSVRASGAPNEVSNGNGAKQHAKQLVNLTRLVELLRESNLNDNDLMELIHQLEKNRHLGKPMAAAIRPEYRFVTNTGFSTPKQESLPATENGNMRKSELNNSTDDSDLLKRPYIDGDKQESKITVNTEAMNKQVSPPRAIPPTVDDIYTQQQRLPHVHLVPLKRAFAVTSQQRRHLDARTTERIYPRRTVAPRSPTPAPVVQNTAVPLTYSTQSAYHSTNNPNAARPTHQQQHSTHPNNDNFDTRRVGSTWFTGANGSIAPRQRWPVEVGNVGAPFRAFSASAAASPTSTSMLIQPFYPAQGQFMQTHAPIFAPPPLAQPFSYFKPPQTSNFPYALNPSIIQYSRPQLPQFY